MQGNCLYYEFILFPHRSLDVVDTTANTGAMDGYGGLINSLSPGAGVTSNTDVQQQTHTQPQVVYATHGSHHHQNKIQAPKEDQQLFHSTKF